ncbi:hypothetical protein JMA_34630 [Jeotgalibacillus malaysiensis]|uniref:Uncharacterized protein n=1 Tax=Jeotgalibacillus malaysiensis TaxID=1508404 RepID=A0A0B5ARA1_9BACL|nr:hypothetical protein JMA_34630 [Jeotgalibacillus malaysiensis]
MKVGGMDIEGGRRGMGDEGDRISFISGLIPSKTNLIPSI